MVKCPQCGYRNKDGVIRCDDCGATLVKMPMDTGMRDDDEKKFEPVSFPVVAVTPEYTKKSNESLYSAPSGGTAVAGLILSIISLFTYGITCIPALICVIMGYRTAKMNDDARGLRISKISFAILGISTFVCFGLLLIGIIFG